MNYRELMDAFSYSGLGALLVAEDNTILDINESGDRLLHGGGSLEGSRLETSAPFLCQDEQDPIFGNPAFNEYLLRCPSPQISELPSSTRMLVFRDATAEFHNGLLKNVFDHVSEAITIWDSKCRMLMLNSAAAKLEAHLINDVLGRHVTSLYEARNNSILVIPKMISDKKPLLNQRQDFVTHSGKELQIVSNNYPILQNDQVFGAMSMMEDWTKLDELNKRIIELQRTLVNHSKNPGAKKGSPLSAKYHFNDIVYSGKSMTATVAKCKRVAKSDAPVLIYGETGTGKELFAQSIHNASPRANNPFIAINCAAIPDTLLESMLFGTEKGAYTGAERREGLFEQADTGTLLLDEINSMDIALQSKLLRVLQERSFRRVGGSKLIHVDVRVLSIINIPPLEAIEQGLLRQDLYYRLGVIIINIPPLCKRKEDILLLAKSFIMDCNQRLSKNVSDVDAATVELFYSYDWPGNVRELHHAIEYAMNILPDSACLITPKDIPEHILEKVDPEMMTSPAISQPTSMESVMQDAGRRYLYHALLEHNGNISSTAKAMGISRQNLQYRMKKLDVHVADLPLEPN